MADRILGFGTTLQVDRGSGYVTIARNVEFSEFGQEADDVEVTDHSSTAGHREFIRGLVDSGELAFTGIYVADSSQTALIADIIAGTTDTDPIDTWRIVLPSGYGTFTSEGFLKAFKINPQMDGRLECSGTIKLTGVPTFATTQSDGLTTPFFVVTPNAGAAAVINPAPAQAVTEYVVTVGTTASSVTITPTATLGVIRVNGTVVASGVASGSIALGAAGSITTITISVTETGETPKEYTLRVSRP